MNKQRKVVITTTYNEMGIIIDTKVEEVAQSNLQPTCNQLATDTISRQMATDALRKMQTYKMFEGDDVLLIDQAGAMTELMLLPTAEPKRGRWLYCEDTTADCVDGYRCDQCGFFVPWDYKHKSIDYIKDYNLCPHCGADMRGKGENSESN